MPLVGEYEPSPAHFVREQVERFEQSGGTDGHLTMGLPVVILTTLGATSGKIRKVPLMRVEHGGEYAVVASRAGKPVNPSWYQNIKLHPIVELQDGAVCQDMSARQVYGEEREVWWQRSVAAFPTYDEYQEKTTRTIPVVVLTPLS